MAKTTLTVSGMMCNGCVNRVQRALAQQAGVNLVEVSLAKKQVSIDFNDAKVTEATLRTAIADLGFDVQP